MTKALPFTFSNERFISRLGLKDPQVALSKDMAAEVIVFELTSPFQHPAVHSGAAREPVVECFEKAVGSFHQNAVTYRHHRCDADLQEL
jgi:hypothetical protein